ncbi:MAG: nucleoside triphosphate pyrophosphohydrolase [SAR116 cluster bacterium]|nr:nucleoside triphosphate pyrophosphohydrolase [Paracoccaceae bacterium]RCL81218.1 MAG: nucleoside triphosphate pyrophosphohydrolase [SAR116 cluster bacterium]RPH14334.1 MAG: nucleoside triphosphate pyrophosphohydrolase [Alphaproteobacteria bacterium TMED150]HCJ61825.1 nucleoside triphosphate pyrophosphohydrolase [Alphaproteobacteria bacterium]
MSSLMKHDLPENALSRIRAVMETLRHKEHGCPWDLEQDHASIAPYMIEEAYELYQALIDRDDDHVRDELGDVLLQVVFHAQMASERGAFDLDDVAHAISEKMIRRHPHVFGSSDGENIREKWEDIKAAERAGKHQKSILDDVPNALPALMRAVKLQKRAARVGFDWNNIDLVLDKMNEELSELVEARRSKDMDHVREEFGDMLFVMANIARHLGIDPEESLRLANQKFEDRFQHMEASCGHDHEAMKSLELQQLEDLWNKAKFDLKSGL